MFRIRNKQKVEFEEKIWGSCCNVFAQGEGIQPLCQCGGEFLTGSKAVLYVFRHLGCLLPSAPPSVYSC